MDPITVATTAAGLALGGASLAIQVLQGCIIGFEYFEAAIDAQNDCDAFKLRLRIEFARLYDWGDLVGLLDEAKHGVYDRNNRQNRMLVVAILNELQYLLHGLRQSSLRYEDDSQSSDADSGPAPSWRPNQQGIVQQRPCLPRDFNDREFEEGGLEIYRSLFAVQTESKNARKHKRGLNHVIDWYNGAKTVASQPRRIVWAVRDKSKFAEQLTKVKELVDYLHETVNEDQMVILLETSRDTQLGMLALTQDVAGLKNLLEVMQRRLPGSASSGVATLDGATLADSDTISLATSSVNGIPESQFRRFLEQVIEFKIIVAKSGGHHPDAKLDPSFHDRLTILGDLDDGLRTRACFKQSTTEAARHCLWIEWKDYNPTPAKDGSPRFVPDPSASVRAEQLVALLRVDPKPAGFRVPTCLGYIVDARKHRFGFLFEAPGKTTAAPLSLASLFRDNARGLRQRVQIALQLSESLLMLHSVDWLHKGLRSANVLFFGSEQNGHKRRSLGQAFISGFEYARRSVIDGTTMGPDSLEWAFYMHPDYLGLKKKEGYKRSYDIYSLGIILLELGYWKPIDQILGFEQEGGRVVPRDDSETQQIAGAELEDEGEKQARDHNDQPRLCKDSLLDIRSTRKRILEGPQEVLEHVEDVMGLKYRNVVTACIEGMSAFGLDEDLDQKDPVIATLMQQEFIRVVIDALRSIVV